MGVSPYTIFIRQTAQNKALKGLTFQQRGQAVAKLYKALSASDKAALIKKAKAAPAITITKVPLSVIDQARAKNIPINLVKENWHSTKGHSTQARLNNIAQKAGLKVYSDSDKAALIEAALAIIKITNGLAPILGQTHASKIPVGLVAKNSTKGASTQSRPNKNAQKAGSE
eukprot:GILI01019311.1.p1 GENE.GILI01019311.1~~GILI01019311.1.p1  ORF type:complete len:179 (+),score=53.54 GILI01019311.1:27-539(+)